MPSILTVTYNASGAAWAGKQGLCVVVVDVISMSTSAEAALDAGALEVWGAAPSSCKAPVFTAPEKIGYQAALAAIEQKTELIIFTEPRVGSPKEREQNALAVLKGIRKAGLDCKEIYPNLGAEVVKFTDFAGKVVVLVTDTGGVAFDAAVYAGAPAVITGTNARTMRKKGVASIADAAERVIDYAHRHETGIAVVAASASAWEDILAAEQISQEIIRKGFLEI